MLPEHGFVKMLVVAWLSVPILKKLVSAWMLLPLLLFAARELMAQYWFMEVKKASRHYVHYLYGSGAVVVWCAVTWLLCPHVWVATAVDAIKESFALIGAIAIWVFSIYSTGGYLALWVANCLGDDSPAHIVSLRIVDSGLNYVRFVVDGPQGPLEFECRTCWRGASGVATRQFELRRGKRGVPWGKLICTDEIPPPHDSRAAPRA